VQVGYRPHGSPIPFKPEILFYHATVRAMTTTPLSPYVGVPFAAVAISLLLRALRPRDGSLAKPWPLEAKRNLLTDRERVLYHRLIDTLPDHIVLAQVQLLQLLKFKGGRRGYAIFNRISLLSLDYVILNSDTSIVAAIELDDATHEREDRRRADARKSHALKSAGIPLIGWNAKSLPDATAIRAALNPS